MTKVVHLTSVHPRNDTRIFIKMCCSLIREGYEVVLVVADGLGDAVIEDIQICDVGKSKDRLQRILKSTKSVYSRAIELNADLYHIHDPELIPIGLKLKKLKKRVVFDAHEDVVKQILGKPYLNQVSRFALSFTFKYFEKWACKKFDAIITATPMIKKKFLAINAKSVDINNYPLLGELAYEQSCLHKKQEIAYVGGISQIRGIREVIKAMDLLPNIRLNLVGRFSEKALKDEVKREGGWSKVNELGQLDREEVARVLSISKLGIVTFLPLPNHIEAQPNKMFEYMSASIPVVCSDFPLWKEIVEGNQCGICVDPEKPELIANAIQELTSKPEKAIKMGAAGRKVIEGKYNWEKEKSKLFKLYKELGC